MRAQCIKIPWRFANEFKKPNTFLCLLRLVYFGDIFVKYSQSENTEVKVLKREYFVMCIYILESSLVFAK